MNVLASRNLDFALLGLRIGLGVLFILAGWAKVSHVAGIVGLWQKLHLPLPHVFGPIHAVVEFGGGILVIAGLYTRLIGFLLAVIMLGALFLVKIHTPTFIQQEWLAFWISLALFVVGAGSLSLDAILEKRRAKGTSQSTAYQY
jgi:putative oxidoreductase